MRTREDLEHLFTSNWEPRAAFQDAWKLFAMRQDHTVTMIDPPLSATQRWLMPRMNCFAYALGLHELPAYHRWIRTHYYARKPLNGGFMEELIEWRWLAEVAIGAPHLGKLVVYKRDDYVTHCGLIIDGQDRVRSKFGIEDFYEHGLLEVQISFGEPQLFLEPPTEQIRRQIMEKLEASA
jgi:hypothetical protein